MSCKCKIACWVYTGFFFFFFFNKQEQLNKIYHSVRLTIEEMKTILTLIVNKARPDITILSKRSMKDQSLIRRQLLNYLTLSLMLALLSAFINSDCFKDQDRPSKILQAYPCFRELHNVSNIFENIFEFLVTSIVFTNVYVWDYSR